MARPSWQTDFALNGQVNCSGEFKPGEIQLKQMPWVASEEERILQNQYVRNQSHLHNYQSDILEITHYNLVEKLLKHKVSKLKKMHGARRRPQSQMSEELLQSQLSPTKARGARPGPDQVFEHGDPREFEFGSPSKKPLNFDIANPQYKPFKKITEDLLGKTLDQDSYFDFDSKSAKSEDDSPVRRKLL